MTWISGETDIYPATKRYTVYCGNQYDRWEKRVINVFNCDSFARWEFRKFCGGTYSYACSSHVDRVLASLTGDKRTELTARDLRTL